MKDSKAKEKAQRAAYRGYDAVVEALNVVQGFSFLSIGKALLNYQMEQRGHLHCPQPRKTCLKAIRADTFQPTIH